MNDKNEKPLQEDKLLEQVQKNKNQDNIDRKGLAKQTLDDGLVIARQTTVEGRGPTGWPYVETDQEAKLTKPHPVRECSIQLRGGFELYTAGESRQKCLASGREPLHAVWETNWDIQNDQHNEGMMDKPRKETVYGMHTK